MSNLMLDHALKYGVDDSNEESSRRQKDVKLSRRKARATLDSFAC